MFSSGEFRTDDDNALQKQATILKNYKTFTLFFF